MDSRRQFRELNGVYASEAESVVILSGNFDSFDHNVIKHPV